MSPRWCSSNVFPTHTVNTADVTWCAKGCGGGIEYRYSSIEVWICSGLELWWRNLGIRIQLVIQKTLDHNQEGRQLKLVSSFCDGPSVFWFWLINEYMTWTDNCEDILGLVGNFTSANTLPSITTSSKGSSSGSDSENVSLGGETPLLTGPAGMC